MLPSYALPGRFFLYEPAGDVLALLPALAEASPLMSMRKASTSCGAPRGRGDVGGASAVPARELPQNNKPNYDKCERGLPQLTMCNKRRCAQNNEPIMSFMRTLHKYCRT